MMMEQISLCAPKTTFLKPKIKPPSLILNPENNLEEEEEEYFLIEMDEIQDMINEKFLSEDENENENKNSLMYISECYKDRLNLKNNSIKSKSSLHQQRNSDTSFETKSSEKESITF
jgi:hypothetical protein